MKKAIKKWKKFYFLIYIRVDYFYLNPRTAVFTDNRCVVCESKTKYCNAQRGNYSKKAKYYCP